MDENGSPGPNDTAESAVTDDPFAAADDAETYTPPTDPVEKPDEHGDARIVGGFSADSMSGDAPVRRSASGGSPDEALADRIRRELVEDGATTDLDVDVEVREGIAYLRGRVSDLVDADNAMAVAGRVPGVVDIIDDELRVEE